MHASLITIALALVSTLGPVSAGNTNSPRRSFREPAHRRHHARQFSGHPNIRRVKRTAACDASSSTTTPSSSADPSTSSEPSSPASEVLTGLTTNSTSTCIVGDYQCSGTQLQECYNDQWNLVQDCTGDNITCAAADSVIGCVYTWQVPSGGNTGPVSGTPLSILPTPSNSIPTVSSPTIPSVSSPTTSSTIPDDDDPGCDDGDDGSSETSQTAFTSAAGSAISTSLAASTTVPSASALATGTSATSHIGQNDIAGGASYSFSNTASSSKGKGHTKTFGSASATPSSSGGFGASSSSPFGSSASVPFGDSSSSSTRRGGKSSALASGSRTASSPATTSTGVVTNVTSGTTTFSAPHYVIYADNWLTTMPSVSDLKSFNRFILSFWVTNGGAVDDAAAWVSFDSATRASVLQEYHAAGIALMVSAFGSTDAPTSSGQDPKQVAQNLATWVKQYGLDGVDIDYEDLDAMNSDTAEAWIITFQTELRSLLPSQYLISHAPVAPWFTSANVYKSGAYVDIFKKVGSGIDFFNIQFYNQGNTYVDCTTLITKSDADWPSTSVFEINSYAGVPLDKIVIGKPLEINSASNGYMSPSALATCVKQAEGKGWNGGVMFWEWSSAAPGIMATVRG